MPDNPPEPTPAPPKPEPTAEEQEAAYWTRFEEKLDNWFDKRVEKMRATASSRTGRTNLPGILSDLVFGPVKKD